MGELKEVSIEVTNKCSLNCIHCSSQSGSELPKELTLDQILQTIDQAKLLGAHILTLSGGEPLLRKDLFEIIAHARENDFEIRLQTSGAYDFGHGLEAIPAEMLTRFLPDSSPQDKIIYSILGLDDAHDQLTSTPESYNLVMKSIHRTSLLHIPIEVHTVPNKLNYQQMLPLAEILNQAGVDSWHLLRLVPQGRCTDHPELTLNKTQFQELQESLSAISKKDLKMKLILGHNLDRRYWSDDNCPASSCAIGEGKLLIRADGKVTYCAALKYHRFGNIQEHNLDYFWNQHPKIQEFRHFLAQEYAQMKGKCHDCDILPQCKGGCIAQRLYCSEDLLQGPDPLCYHQPSKK